MLVRIDLSEPATSRALERIDALVTDAAATKVQIILSR